jgi:hypothetical protein
MNIEHIEHIKIEIEISIKRNDIFSSHEMTINFWESI